MFNLLDALDALAVRLGIMVKVVPDVEGILVLCDRQETAYVWMYRCVWVLVLIQVLSVLFLDATVLNNISAILVSMLGLMVIRSYTQANEAVRGITTFALTLQRIIDAQAATIESQRNALDSLSGIEH